MGLANMSSAAHPRSFDGPEAVSADWPTNMTSSSPFNFSADTAAGLIEDYLANMFTVTQPTTIALICLYAPVFLFSLAGNSFVIVMFVKDRRMRRVKSLFLVNLALDWTQFPSSLSSTESDLLGHYPRLDSLQHSNFFIIFDLSVSLFRKRGQFSFTLYWNGFARL